ncbi:hypothetical protein Tco_0575970 [Tanacetum coccineum]
MKQAVDCIEMTRLKSKGIIKHIRFHGKDQEVHLPAESSSTDTPLEQVQNNDEKNVFANERQHSEKHAAECADERAALANLIANLTLDTEENKTILKQLKKANASLTQELKECKTNLDGILPPMGKTHDSLKRRVDHKLDKDQKKAKKSAQLQKDKEVNGKPSMIDPTRLPNTANGCKPKPRNWQASMSSRLNKDFHLGEHRKQKSLLEVQ